jgi:hypothetical protein
MLAVWRNEDNGTVVRHSPGTTNGSSTDRGVVPVVALFTSLCFCVTLEFVTALRYPVYSITSSLDKNRQFRSVRTCWRSERLSIEPEV